MRLLVDEQRIALLSAIVHNEVSDSHKSQQMRRVTHHVPQVPALMYSRTITRLKWIGAIP